MKTLQHITVVLCLLVTTGCTVQPAPVHVGVTQSSVLPPIEQSACVFAFVPDVTGAHAPIEVHTLFGNDDQLQRVADAIGATKLVGGDSGFDVYETSKYAIDPYWSDEERQLLYDMPESPDAVYLLQTEEALHLTEGLGCGDEA